MRYLIINADDFGIGPAVSDGILHLAERGVVTGTLLLANSPHAEDAVQQWRQRHAALEVGWHAALTLDGPVLPPAQVPTLVNPDGRFWGLGTFVKRLWSGRLARREIRAELQAQYERCCALLGRPPAIVTTHHHVQIFAPVGALLRDVIAGQRPRPYLRVIREPWPLLWRVRGARLKRLLINGLGRRDGFRLSGASGFHNEWLVGIGDPVCVQDPDFMVRWIRRVPGQVVELTCHPGHYDETPIGRDCTVEDGMIERRVQELHLLGEPRFADACRTAGFSIVSAAELHKFVNGSAN